MATLAALRTALESTLGAGFTAVSASVNVYPEMVDRPVPPCVILGLGDPPIEYLTMGRGRDQWNFELTILVPSASVIAAQDALAAYVSSSGDLSIRRIVEAANTLGLANTNAHVAGVSAFGFRHPAAGNEHVGATVRVPVVTSGTS